MYDQSVSRRSDDVSGFRRVLPRGRNAVSREIVRLSQRERLLEAMTELAAVKGFAAVTIADLVAHAGVAKPTFYEHFADKQACFLAVYDGILGAGIAAINDALDPAASVEERVVHGIRALLTFMAADDSRARFFLLEAGSAGDAAMDRVTMAHRAFADYYISLREQVREHAPEYPPVSPVRAQAIVGAVNEPMCGILRDGTADQILELEGEIVAVVRALALAPS